MREWAAAHPGTIVEPKAFGVALHFRARFELADAARALTAGLIEGDARFQLLRGLMLWEIRPAGVDKGGAVRALMAEAPFAGRLPLFVGDDTTDADGIAAAEALGGAGLWVDRAFGSPAAVRAWLARAAEAGEWPNLPGGDA